MAPGGKTAGASVALLCLALAFGVAVRIGDRRPEPPFAADPPRAAAHRDDAPPVRVAPDHADRASATPQLTPDFVLEGLAPEDAPPDPAFVITGRVAWEGDGAPVAGCRVSVTTEAIDTLRPPPELLDTGLPEQDVPADLVSAVTGRTGRFELAGVPPRTDVLLRFELPGGGLDVQDLRAPPERERTVWQGEFLVRRRGRLAGTVVSTDGEPLANVRVRAVDLPRLDADTLQPAEREFWLGGAERRDTRGVLATAAERARQRRLAFPVTDTDAEGRFVLDDLRSGEVDLVLSHPDHGGRHERVPVVADRTTNVGFVTLEPTALASVRVLAAVDGPPVPGVAVAIQHPRLPLGSLAHRTDADGIARFAGIPRQGTATLLHEPDIAHVLELNLRERLAYFEKIERLRRSRLTHVLVRRRAGDPWSIAGQLRGTPTEVVLPPTHSLRVYPRAASPLPDELPEMVLRPRAPSAGIKTVPGGGVEITGLPEAAIRKDTGEVNCCVVLQFAAHAPVVLQWPGTDKEVRVELFPTFPVEIHVTDLDGAPLAGAAIDIEFPHERPDGQVWSALGVLRLGRTDERGVLHADALWKATARLRVRHPATNCSDWTCVERLLPGMRIELREQGVGQVRGRLLDGGLAVDRRYIVALHPDRDDPAVRGHRPRGVFSRADSSYELQDVPAGSWHVRVLDTALRPVGRFVSHRRRPTLPPLDDLMPVRAGRELAVDLDIRDPDGADAALRGVVRAALPPRSRIRIRLPVRPGPLSPGHGQSTTASPGPHGRFAFAEVPGGWDGRAVLEVRSGYGWERWATARELRAHDEPVVFELHHGALTLALFDAEGRALAHRLVELRRDDGFAVTRVADRTGTVQCDAVPAGEYAVAMASFGGAVPRFDEVRITIRDGGHTLRELVADPD